MVSFDNTAIAFADRSDGDLRRMKLLFSLMGKPGLVGAGKSALQASVRLGVPFAWAAKPTVFKQFCGGESAGGCEPTIARLHSAGILSLLDYSAEGKENEADFDRCLLETLQTIHQAEGDPRLPFAVFKPSGLIPASLLKKQGSGKPLSADEQGRWERGVARVQAICEAAHRAGVPVMIDAEESWLQVAIDRLAEDMMVRFNTERITVVNTFQLYRTDRLQYLMDSFSKAEASGYRLGAKLVRGAYMEKERARAAKKGYASPIHPTKEATDRAFDEAVSFCITRSDRMLTVIGSHNEQSCLRAVGLLGDAQSAAAQRVYFSQLYGMSDHISYNLAHHGYRVVKYVPYGPVAEVMPYLVRRAEENTSVAGQVGRELSLIIREMGRRRGTRP